MRNWRTLWWVLIFGLPNLLWFAYLRALVLANGGEAAQRGAADWLDLLLPLASAAGLLITLRFFRPQGDLRVDAGEHRFRKLIALTSDSYWVIDENLRICSIDADPQNRLTGVVPDLLGRYMWTLAAHTTLDQSAHATAIKTAFARRERIANLELDLVDRDGRPLMLTICAAPFFDDSGGFHGFCGIARDVTRRRQFEATSGLYETALREASEPIMITDGELDQPGPRITFVNPAFCAMSGYSAEELLGATPRILQGPGTERSAMDALRQKLVGGETVRIEALNYRKSGEPFYVAWQINPVRDANGKIVAFISIHQDVSARREAEFTLRDMNIRLEERVRERTRDLEHAAKELEAFSFSVSHDLRAPLRIVEGFAEILSEDYGTKLDTLGNDHLKRIRTAASRMSQMITSLLAMARTSGAPIARETVDLSNIAEEVLSDLARETPDRQVSTVIAPQIRAEADRVLLRVVMQNLLANAWKFSAHATDANIEFGVSGEFGEATYFIRDNGAGFDMKYIERLFGVFQRLHSQSEFVGTGVGLATVKRIINRHGGKIWAKSTVAGGATFYFTLSGADIAAESPADKSASG